MTTAGSHERKGWAMPAKPDARVGARRRLRHFPRRRYLQVGVAVTHSLMRCWRTGIAAVRDLNARLPWRRRVAHPSLASEAVREWESTYSKCYIYHFKCCRGARGPERRCRCAVRFACAPRSARPGCGTKRPRVSPRSCRPTARQAPADSAVPTLRQAP